MSLPPTCNRVGFTYAFGSISGSIPGCTKEETNFLEINAMMDPLVCPPSKRPLDKHDLPLMGWAAGIIERSTYFGVLFSSICRSSTVICEVN